jgi:hypothetical protein
MVHRCAKCVCVYRLQADAGWYDSGVWSKHFPLSLCCKMQAALTIVHLFNVNTMHTIKLYMQFCTGKQLIFIIDNAKVA